MSIKPNPKAAEYAGFDRFETPDGERFGSFEVFWVDAMSIQSDEEGEYLPEGWYWWACFPGCIPDGDPSGPYETSKEAWQEAQDIY